MSVRSLPPFQTLLDAHRTDVWRFLAAMLGPQDAEDCYQDTWLAALRGYPALRDAGNLRGWLLTIAHRKAVDEFRARPRRGEPLAEVPERAEPEPAAPEPALWAALRRLPPKQRAAVVHRYVGDLAYADIAAVMGISPAAARANVHEGLRKLRQTWPV